MATSGFRISWAIPVAHRTQSRQAVGAPLVLLEGLEPGVVVEHRDRPADLALVVVKRRGVDDQGQGPSLGLAHGHLRLGVRLIVEARPEHGAERRVQHVQGPADDAGRLDAEDALRRGVERRDDPVLPSGDDA
jgi:hypothetical protein